jgi:hypothetical protein
MMSMLRSADFNLHHRDVVGVGIGGDRAAERVADLLQARRRGHREPGVPQELHHLTAHLKLSEVAVQVDPIQTRRHDDRRNQTLRRPSMHPQTQNPLRHQPPRRYQAKPAWMVDRIAVGWAHVRLAARSASRPYIGRDRRTIATRSAVAHAPSIGGR